MAKEKKVRTQILSGMFWKSGERLLAQGVSFIVSVVLARILAPSEYGVVGMALVFITIADVFVNSGFATALIQKKDSDETDFSTIFYCSLVVSILLYGIIFLLAPLFASFFNEPALTDLLRVLALRVPLSSYNSIQHAYVSRNMLFRRFFFSTLFGTVISGIAGIWLAYRGWGFWALVVQYMMNTVVDTIVLAFTVKWHPKRLFSWSAAKKLMNYGSKILFADLGGTAFGQLRTFIIGKYYSLTDLAFYNKGQQVPALVSDNLGQTIITVLFPAISNEAGDEERVKFLTKKAMQVLSFVLFPFLFGMAAVAEPLVVALYTEKWLDSVFFIQVISVSLAFGMLSIMSLQTIKAIGRSDVVLKLEFIKKPVYIGLLVIGVLNGVKAIAVMMAVYELFGTFINMLQLRKHIHYGIREQIMDIGPATILSTIMLAAVWLIPLPFSSAWITLLVKVLMGVAIYSVGALLIKPSAYYYVIDIVSDLLKRKGKTGEPET